jgi:signal transduction histidine kinase
VAIERQGQTESAVRPTSVAVGCIAVALAYVLTARIGQLMAIPPGNVTSVWIPSGLVMAALLTRGLYLWPGVFVGAFLGNIWAYFSTDSPASIGSALLAGVANGTGDALGSYVGARLVLRAALGRSPFERVAGVVGFIGAGAGLSSAISALFGVSALALVGILPWSQYDYTLATWFFGDAVGVIILTPAILAWIRPRPRLDLEAVVFLGVVALVAAHSLDVLPISLPFTLPLFTLTPLFMWAVFRLSAVVSYTSILVVTGMSVMATVRGAGPFALDTLYDALLGLQLFLATMSGTVLLFHAMSAERLATLSELASLNVALETRVADRTAALTAELSARAAAEAEKVSLERQVLHAQKLESLGMLAGGVAHDYNNVLTVIIANAELALLEQPEGGAARRNIEQVVSAANRSAALTRQMLAYSGRGTFQLVEIDIGAQLRALREMLAVAAGRKVRLTVSVDDAVPSIVVDPAQLDQLVMNLVINAGESITSDSGEVAVAASVGAYAEADFALATYAAADQRPGTYVRIRVRDTGCGMDEGTRLRMFDPFFTSKSAGRGLGMAVVLGIVRGHHGVILVRSELGVGTTFDVLLPASQSGALAQLK